MIERASLHTIRVALAAVVGTAIAGSGCADPVEPELGAGFATVSGEVQTFGGEPFSGEIGIFCGPEGPTDFGRSYRTSGPGQYSADLLVPSRSASARSLEATEYRLVCRFVAVSGLPFRTDTAAVQFYPELADVTPQRIDLIPE